VKAITWLAELGLFTTSLVAAEHRVEHELACGDTVRRGRPDRLALEYLPVA
jgi:hypothetical protein